MEMSSDVGKNTVDIHVVELSLEMEGLNGKHF
jgi:hypothetical protein